MKQRAREYVPQGRASYLARHRHHFIAKRKASKCEASGDQVQALAHALFRTDGCVALGGEPSGDIQAGTQRRARIDADLLSTFMHLGQVWLCRPEAPVHDLVDDSDWLEIDHQMMAHRRGQSA